MPSDELPIQILQRWGGGSRENGSRLFKILYRLLLGHDAFPVPDWFDGDRMDGSFCRNHLHRKGPVSEHLDFSDPRTWLLGIRHRVRGHQCTVKFAYG